AEEILDGHLRVKDVAAIALEAELEPARHREARDDPVRLTQESALVVDRLLGGRRASLFGRLERRGARGDPRLGGVARREQEREGRERGEPQSTLPANACPCVTPEGGGRPTRISPTVPPAMPGAPAS